MNKSFLALLAATMVALGACSDLKKSDDKNSLSEATADTAVVARTGNTPTQAAANAASSVENAASKAGDALSDAFDLSKEKLENVRLPELTVTGLTTRSNQLYQVYDLNEEILFDTDKATVKPSAAEALNQIGASINKRFPNRKVRVLGFADSRGDKAYNRTLSKERAEAVKTYLVTTDKMDASRVSTEAFGETEPVATNATPAGRQENRRVEIAVRIVD